MNSDDVRGWSRVIGKLLVVVSIIAACLGVWRYMATAAFLDKALTADGTVVELRPDRSGDGTTMYHAVFEFRDEAGTSHRKVSSWSSSPPRYAVGAQLKVLYLPNNPSDARISGFMSLWMFPALCAFSAFSNFVFGALLLWIVPYAIRRMWPRSQAAAATEHDAVAMR